MMERLTKRIPVPKEKRDVVVFTQGEYSDTIPAEMTHEDTRKVLRKLAEYEDAEEQGLLLRLPCKVGDSIYSVIEDGLTIFELKFSLDFYARRKIDFGKTVFLTKAEAEQKLKGMECE